MADLILPPGWQQKGSGGGIYYVDENVGGFTTYDLYVAQDAGPLALSSAFFWSCTKQAWVQPWEVPLGDGTGKKVLKVGPDGAPLQALAAASSSSAAPPGAARAPSLSAVGASRPSGLGGSAGGGSAGGGGEVAKRLISDFPPRIPPGDGEWFERGRDGDYVVFENKGTGAKCTELWGVEEWDGEGGDVVTFFNWKTMERWDQPPGAVGADGKRPVLINIPSTHISQAPAAMAAIVASLSAPAEGEEEQNRSALPSLLSVVRKPTVLVAPIVIPNNARRVTAAESAAAAAAAAEASKAARRKAAAQALAAGVGIVAAPKGGVVGIGGFKAPASSAASTQAWKAKNTATAAGVGSNSATAAASAPASVASAAAAAAAAAEDAGAETAALELAMPSGWEAITDADTGDTYFAHAESGVALWTLWLAVRAGGGGGGGGGGGWRYFKAPAFGEESEGRPAVEDDDTTAAIVGANGSRHTAADAEDAGGAEAAGAERAAGEEEGAAAAEEGAEAAAEGGEEAPLAEGWAAVVDADSGETFFYHEASGETTWERPTA